MFARLSTVVLTASALAVAMPGGGWGGGSTTTVTVTAPATTVTAASQCNTGDIQCCNSTSSASDPATSLLLGLLGIVVQGVDVLVGIDCSPISVLSGGSSCTAEPVCCENNNFNGLISLGCSPINLNLK
ncbi:fungal hydrophobin [Coniophora puteana RWD-64-598 SS2]|uniref:Hydrophobin n=1 Tax=Coniophora puteana (strain RWD-64-598) TaxID=741705 RepID=A0A5M3N3F7_CONPW|nr:fungal hydrophobin [Coniophora puteana RWD-64-598 SS2]EIW85893.1 fungal hydrophobin [Coniophora puteana RWD-64-598 SS2]